MYDKGILKRQVRRDGSIEYYWYDQYESGIPTKIEYINEKGRIIRTHWRAGDWGVNITYYDKEGNVRVTDQILDDGEIRFVYLGGSRVVNQILDRVNNYFSDFVNDPRLVPVALEAIRKFISFGLYPEERIALENAIAKLQSIPQGEFEFYPWEPSSQSLLRSSETTRDSSSSIGDISNCPPFGPCIPPRKSAPGITKRTKKAPLTPQQYCEICRRWQEQQEVYQQPQQYPYQQYPQQNWMTYTQALQPASSNIWQRSGGARISPVSTPTSRVRIATSPVTAPTTSPTTFTIKGRPYPYGYWK